METLEEDRDLQAALGQQARNDLLLEHAPQLARHARGEEESRLADVEGESARGADRVVEHFGGGRQHRLLAIVGRHLPAAQPEEFFHALQPRFVEHQLDPGGARGDLLRQIIHRRTESAIDDHRVGALSGEFEGQQQAVAIVADGGLPAHRQAHVLQLLRDVAEVGVDDLAGEHFVAGAYDFDAHVVKLLGCLGAPPSMAQCRRRRDEAAEAGASGAFKVVQDTSRQHPTNREA